MAPHHFKVQKENTDMNDRLVLARAPGIKNRSVTFIATCGVGFLSNTARPRDPPPSPTALHPDPASPLVPEIQSLGCKSDLLRFFAP